MFTLDLKKECVTLCRDIYTSRLSSEHVGVQDIRFALVHGILVFRGTANIQNFFRDIFVLPRKFDNIYAHGGFAEAAELIFPHIEKLVPPGLRAHICTTGHSFGGSLAFMVALRWGCPAVTFGCPRVVLKGSFPPPLRHSRNACDDDPVTMIPRLLYKHVDRAEWLRDRDGRKIQPKDHGIDVYYRRIFAL